MDTQEYRYIEEDALLLKPIYRSHEERRKVFEEILAEIHHQEGQLFTNSSLTNEEIQHWMEVYEQTDEMFGQRADALLQEEGDYEVHEQEVQDETSMTDDEFLEAANILSHEHEENRKARVAHVEKHHA